MVKAGDAVGTNGGTNNTDKPYLCHIHYELRVDDGSTFGRPVWGDPAKFRLYSVKLWAGARVKVTAHLLNVRAEPGTHSPVLAQLPFGAEAIVKQHKDNGIFAYNYHWWYIGDGWLAESYLEAVEEGCPECARLRDENARLSTVLEEAERMITNAKRELGC